MRICQKGSRQLEALLPEAQPVAAVYRPSVFNCIHRDGANIWLFNTMSRRLAQLTPEEEAFVRAGQVSGTDRLAAALIGARFLVPQDTDETAQYLQLYSTQELFAGAMDRGYTMYDILPTTGCNARCFYCFEAGTQPIHMSGETADAVVSFIQKTRDTTQKTRLSWFGGEPLCCPQIIDRICAGVREAGIDYYSTMITNGSLVTPELVQKAKDDWLLDKVQITLDGTGPEHERRKDYVGLSNGFDRTLQNIRLLLDAGIGVIVRMNMDPDNTDSIEALYALLKTRFSPAERIAFDPALLAQKWFRWSAERTPQAQALLRERWQRLKQRICDDGYDRSKPLETGLPRFHCMANATTSVTILPNGKLSMCQTGNEALHYGDIWQGITKPELVQQWRCNTNIREQCRDCCWLPECTGFAMCPALETDCRKAMHSRFLCRLARTCQTLD